MAFKRRVHELDGGYCVMLGRGLCDGPLDAAHVIPKSRLRDRGYGADVIYDERVAMSLCRRHHDRHDRCIEKVPFSYIPARCRDFLVELNLADVLRETAA